MINLRESQDIYTLLNSLRTLATAHQADRGDEAAIRLTEAARRTSDGPTPDQVVALLHDLRAALAEAAEETGYLVDYPGRRVELAVVNGDLL